MKAISADRPSLLRSAPPRRIGKFGADSYLPRAMIVFIAFVAAEETLRSRWLRNGTSALRPTSEPIFSKTRHASILTPESLSFSSTITDSSATFPRSCSRCTASRRPWFRATIAQSALIAPGVPICFSTSATQP